MTKVVYWSSVISR